MDNLKLSINQDFEDFKATRLAIFIVFDVVLFILYFIFWLPLLLKMTRDIWRTRSMITMIPLKVIQK
jgi:hypothetical protein